MLLWSIWRSFKCVYYLFILVYVYILQYILYIPFYIAEIFFTNNVVTDGSSEYSSAMHVNVANCFMIVAR